MTLISPAVQVVVVAMALATIALGFDWYRPGRTRRLVTALAAAVVITGALALAHFTLDFVSYDFPTSFFVWVGIAVFALCLAVVSFLGGIVPFLRPRRRRPSGSSGAPGAAPTPGRLRRRPRDDDEDLFRHTATALWLRRGASVVAVPLAVVMTLMLINSYYAYFPTVYSLTHDTNTPQTTLAQLNAQRSQGASSTSGTSGTSETLQVTIPPTVSHFNPRPAYVWVPPAYVAGKVSHLPVLLMLSGSVGAPSAWLQAGHADTTAQAFADSHNGIAPIMVMPDENGSVTADTECVDGPRGNSETYLTTDVPNFMKANFGADISNGSWGAVGLSGGGTCALMLSLRHPTLFSTFADYSGLTSPTPSEVVDPQATADALFSGNLQAYYEHDPLHLLTQRPLPKLSGIFEVGGDDKYALPAQQQITALMRSGGLATCSWVGGTGKSHSYAFWAPAFQNSLPLLSANLKLTPPDPSAFPGTCTPAASS